MKIIHVCKECNNWEDIKIDKNLVFPGIWECPKCGHPHSEDEFMECQVD